jgi:hypothetical protein
MSETQRRPPRNEAESDAAVFERLADQYADRDVGELFEYLAQSFREESS